ncbi:MAG: hypothetical protein U1A72_03860 [Sulfuritalea sp.]|nr:hypothetical protein [Sulfuritalea sp.]
MRLLAVWLINAAALLALPYLLPSIHVAGMNAARKHFPGIQHES